MQKLGLLFLSVFAVGLGILTYILFQKTFININLDIFITSSPKEVFMFIKDPQHLPDIHHRTKSAQLHRMVVDPDGTEHRQYTVTEDFRHIGLETVTMHSTANPDTLAIHISSVSLYSLVRCHTVLNMKPFQSHNQQGTLVTESLDIYIPFALKRFVNKTIYETHISMLENLKFILERTSNVDRGLSNEFERSFDSEDSSKTEHSSHDRDWSGFDDVWDEVEEQEEVLKEEVKKVVILHEEDEEDFFFGG